MPTTITINNITGSSPFNIYLCDSTNVTCVYINTIPSSSLPYNFEVPSVLSSLSSFNLKIVDIAGCIFYKNLIPTTI